LLVRAVYGESTRKSLKKSPAQLAGKGYSLITTIMLNKTRFLTFVIFKQRERIGMPGAGSGLKTGIARDVTGKLEYWKVFIIIGKAK